MVVVEPGGPDPGASGWDRHGDKVAERLARQLVTDIRANRLDPGGRLDAEAIMMSRYGVGRSTLREALRMLEVQGLITIKPGRGGGPVLMTRDGASQFAEASKLRLHYIGATYEEVLAARIELEPRTPRLAAERAAAGVELDELRAVLDSADHADLADDLAYLAMTRGFHATLVRSSGNRVLALLAETLKEVYDGRTRTPLRPVENRDRARAEHRAIAQAVLRGQAHLAETLMREHMEQFVDLIRPYPGVLNQIISWD